MHNFIMMFFRLIITDGSAEALLYCYDSLVPIVFGCSLNEWKSLEDKTQQFGELTYQKLKKSAGLLPQVCHVLCTCNQVYLLVFHCTAPSWLLI